MGTRRNTLGWEHPSTLTSKANLASTYRNQGRWKEAEELEVQVVEMSARVGASFHTGQHEQSRIYVKRPRSQGQGYFINGEMLPVAEISPWASASIHNIVA